MTHLNNQEISQLIRTSISGPPSPLDASASPYRSKAKAQAFLAIPQEHHSAVSTNPVGAPWTAQACSRESSSSQHQRPSPTRALAVHDAGIPAPSTLFTSAMELFKRTHRGSASPEGVTFGPTTAFQQQSVVAPIPTVTGTIQSASKTRLQNHQRQLRKLQKHGSREIRIPELADQTRTPTSNSSLLSSLPSWRKSTLERLSRMFQTSPRIPLADIHLSSLTSTDEPDADVLMEFDNDVAEALLSLGGQYLNIPPEELMQSTGLRKLVARNIRWFQKTPDCVKLMGLMLAKKFNGAMYRTDSLKRPYALLESESSDDSPEPAPLSLSNTVIGSNCPMTTVETQEWSDVLPDTLPTSSDPISAPVDESDAHVPPDTPSHKRQRRHPPLRLSRKSSRSKCLPELPLLVESPTSSPHHPSSTTTSEEHDQEDEKENDPSKVTKLISLHKRVRAVRKVKKPEDATQEVKKSPRKKTKVTDAPEGSLNEVQQCTQEAEKPEQTES